MMKTRILSVVLVLMFAFSCVAYADMFLDTPAFDYDTLKLELSGNTTNNYKEGITLSVMPYSTDRSMLTDDAVSAGSMLIDYVVSQNDGSFTYSAILNEDFAPGKYTVYADTLSQSATATFILVVGSEAQGVINSVNGAVTPGEVKTVIGNNTEVLAIDEAEFAKYADYISNVIYASKSAGGYGVGDFVKQYNTAYAVALLKNGVITINGLVKDYGSIIGIDADEYNTLTDVAKAELGKLIKAETIYSGDIMNYDYNFVLAKIKTAAGYEEQGAYIIENADFIGIDLDKYNSITNKFYKDKALKLVFNTNFVSLEAVKTAWNNAVDNAYGEWKGDKNTAGGSGGGGGGGGGGAIGTDNGFTVTDTEDVEDMIATEEVKPTYDEDKSMPFTDVSTHWAYATIKSMYAKGIVNGYDDGTFKPNNTVTRAEFVKMLTGAITLATTDTSSISFTDVADSDWYSECVKLAAANGLVQGHDGMFRPLDKISRQDAAIVIYNAISGAGYTLNGEKTFDDTSDISDYAKASVSALAANGVINGSDGNFLPLNTLTRAEAVKLIENLLKYIQ